MAKCLMLQGTGSSVGKSRLATGLCRVFMQDGFKVAPFKSQNMALNTYITDDGLEIGRAQAIQAEASQIEPSVLMNPVLLKPNSDKKSEVIVMGKNYKNLSAIDYHEHKPELLSIIKRAYDKLAKQNDIIVIEGAGSPAEINLRERDIVNMGMAELVDAPVVLIGDIDKGGVFASLAGTMLLLTEDERVRVKGVIINKFRGDIKLLNPGLDMLEDIIKRPVLGVVPYAMDIYIDEEDSLNSEILRSRQNQQNRASDSIDIKVLCLPRITNFTDFVPLTKRPDVKLSYINTGDLIGNADVLIIPGSENPIEDLKVIQKQGWGEEIKKLAQKGAIILGISGGYSILSKNIRSNSKQTKGLALLDVETSITDKQLKSRVSGYITDKAFSSKKYMHKVIIKGYVIGEIKAEKKGNVRDFIRLSSGAKDEFDGVISLDGKVFGTNFHGIFDNSDFTNEFIKYVYKMKTGELLAEDIPSFDYLEYRQTEYDKWADVVRESIDIAKLYEIMNL